MPVLAIGPGSQEEALLNRLHEVGRRKNRGEAASIAVASFDPSLVLVTHDKVAALFGLTELYSLSGERCIRTPTLVRRLFEVGVLTLEAVHHWVKCNSLEFPVWWEGWLAVVQGGRVVAR